MTTYRLTDESGETRFVGTISPAPGGGSQALTSLGEFVIADVLAGPVTVLTPAADDHLVALFAQVIVASDVSQLQLCFQCLDVRVGVVQYVSQEVTTLFAAYDALPAFQVGLSSGALMAAPWQANHAYPGFLYGAGGQQDSVFGGGHLWEGDANTNPTGTSGGSEPDWASNFGGTVDDGTVTWSDQGEIPSMGTTSFFVQVEKVS